MKVLLLSVSAGAGHVRAAQAVETAIREEHPDIEVLHVDLMHVSKGFFPRFYAGGYVKVCLHAPWLFGFFYRFWDHPHPILDPIRIALESFFTRELDRVIEEFRPDVIASTHFLPAYLLAGQPDRTRGARQAIIITDFVAHRFWLNRGVDAYFVPIAETAARLIDSGISPDTVHVLGIPIHPDFSRPPGHAEALDRFGIPGDLPLVLLLCGGYGFGPNERIAEGLAQMKTQARIVAVTGYNEKLKRRLEAIFKQTGTPSRVLGFVREMEVLLAAADLAVPKPGALTACECLTMELPMVIADPVPGQEENNARKLVDWGCGILVRDPESVAEEVATLLDDPERIRRMKQACRKHSAPRAAFDIADILVHLNNG